MTRRRSRAGAALLGFLALAAAGCTGSVPNIGGPWSPSPGAKQPAGKAVIPATLTAFHSCPDALAALRKAAKASVTTYGLHNVMAPGGDVAFATGAGPVNAPAAAAAPAAPAGTAAGSATPAYSGTNDYTAGVDEPDLVKTDGHRIVTIAGSTLEVIDAASRRVTGTLNLASAGIQGGGAANLLLSGDHALVFVPYASLFGAGGSAGTAARYGSRFLLVDLTGKPRVIASYSIDGSMVDARQVGSVVRVVTDSAPAIVFPNLPDATTNAKRVAAYRAAAGQAGLDAWLPGYESSGGGTQISGHVPCTALSRPKTYSGTNLLTVLTFDLSANKFGTGDPVSVVADGDTVYGTTSSLYVASDGMGTALPYGVMEPYTPVSQARQQTQVYRFDITQPGAPRFVASGTVPGYLLNQYSMSEWNGFFRIATTTGTSWALADGEPSGARTSSSAVYELTTSGPDMRIVGKVTGLGSTERIYSVRFMGPVGYVVTFRQTDPLYTLDLSDPATPRVVGALGLTGYSAYLDPVSASQLIGVGQRADVQGHVLGTQVSLFDVSDLAAPARLATYSLPWSTSQAQFDPHAFLYWPADQLVVVPIQTSGGFAATGTIAPSPPLATQPPPTPTSTPESGALVLRISGSRITVVGFIRPPQSGVYGLSVERSLVIGQTLWTVSDNGVLASDLATLRPQAWLPFPGGLHIYPIEVPGAATLP
jgi:hypothetical protein